MTDNTTPEPSAETVAELEAALAYGAVTDHQIIDSVEGLHALYHAVAAEEQHDKFWPQIQGWMDELEDPSDEMQRIRYMDRARDWLKEAGRGMSEWIWAHDLPYVQITFFNTTGSPRFIRVDAREPQ